MRGSFFWAPPFFKSVEVVEKEADDRGAFALTGIDVAAFGRSGVLDDKAVPERGILKTLASDCPTEESFIVACDWTLLECSKVDGSIRFWRSKHAVDLVALDAVKTKRGGRLPFKAVSVCFPTAIQSTSRIFLFCSTSH